MTELQKIMQYLWDAASKNRSRAALQDWKDDIENDRKTDLVTPDDLKYPKRPRKETKTRGYRSGT